MIVGTAKPFDFVRGFNGVEMLVVALDSGVAVMGLYSGLDAPQDLQMLALKGWAHFLQWVCPSPLFERVDLLPRVA